MVYVWPYFIYIHVGYGLCLTIFHMHSCWIWFMPDHISFTFMLDMVCAWPYFICIHVGYGFVSDYISFTFMLDMVYAWPYFIYIHVGYGLCLTIFHLHSCWIWFCVWPYFIYIHVGYGFVSDHISFTFMLDMVYVWHYSICIHIGYRLCIAMLHMHSYQVGFMTGHTSLLGGNITRKLLSLSLDLFFKILLFRVTFLIFFATAIFSTYSLRVGLLLQYVALFQSGN